MARRDPRRFRPRLEQFENRTVPTAMVGVTASDTFEGSATGGLSFARTNDDLSGSLTVNYAVSGTAVPGTDYTALSGTVTFDVGQNWVHVPVTALTPTGGTTVIATLSSSPDYTIDPDQPSATTNIDDQPVTVSVFWQSNGSEGGPLGPLTNGAFQFARSGDLSAPLTATYSVGGSATAGMSYQPLSGSVTFAAGQSFVTVPVNVLNDGDPVPKTVTVTLDDFGMYGLGNDSDTVFILDADARQLVWTGGAGNGLWEDQNNWVIAGTSTPALPGGGDDVFFNSGSIGCSDAGLTPVSGLHLTGAFTGTVTLATALWVNTYEQTSGTLNQPLGDDLSTAVAFIWSGGTLNTLDGGANVTVSGAGQIAPTGAGPVFTAATINVNASGTLKVLPGTLTFTNNSEGMKIAGRVDIYVSPPDNVDVITVNQSVGSTTEVLVQSGASLSLVVHDPTKLGGITFNLPISNEGGTVSAGANGGLRLIANGQLGANGPSISQQSGSWHWYTGTDIEVKFGMSLTDGTLSVRGLAAGTVAHLVGNLTVGDGTSNPFIGFSDLNYTTFEVVGNVNWMSGFYRPNYDTTSDKASLWRVTGTFTIANGVTIAPNPVGNGTPRSGTWHILLGLKGITGDPTQVTLRPPDNVNTWKLGIETKPDNSRYWNLLEVE